MWILSCTASMGYLSRMTQWKVRIKSSSLLSFVERQLNGSLEQVGHARQRIAPGWWKQIKVEIRTFFLPCPAGCRHISTSVSTFIRELLSCPQLIDHAHAVHRATHVPVGEDQSQHLEFARECATNFNHTYAPHLVSPETILCKLDICRGQETF